MEIRNIEQARVELKQDMRQNLKRFAVYFLIVFAVINCGLLIFFYVEECYSYTPVEPKYLQKCIELCNEVTNLKKKSINLGATKISNEMGNITKNCVRKHCLMNKDLRQHPCRLNSYMYNKWGEYVFSIMFTIGKSYSLLNTNHH